jgi:hypothetical protein
MIVRSSVILLTTFTNEYDSFLFVQPYDSGKDQKKLTGVHIILVDCSWQGDN